MSTNGWVATRAMSRGLAIASVAGAVGVWTGRVDIAATGGAVLLAVALAARPGRPRAPAGVQASAPRTAAAGDVVVLRITAHTPHGTEWLALRLPSAAGGAHAVQRVCAVAAERTVIERRFDVAGWGNLRLARPDWAAATADGLFVSGPVEAPDVRVSVVPAPSGGGVVALAPRRSGGLGSHRARTPGDGSEVLGVREYRPGDLLRRIDWRVSNRRSASRHPRVRRTSLYVRTMVAETDSEVLLLVDTRLDIAPSMAAWDLDLTARPGGTPPEGHWYHRWWRRVRSWVRTSEAEAPPRVDASLRPAAASPGGSLDATVEAAVAVAADHIHAGDRVSLIDLGRPRASLPAGSGRRHLDRIRHRLGQVAVDKVSVWRQGTLVPVVTPLIARTPTQSVAVVVSAFYDHDVIDLTVFLARGGRPVVAVDTAPPYVTPDPRVARSVEALALIAAERARRLQRLHDAGVRLTRWGGPEWPAAGTNGPGHRAPRSPASGMRGPR